MELLIFKNKLCILLYVQVVKNRISINNKLNYIFSKTTYIYYKEENYVLYSVKRMRYLSIKYVNVPKYEPIYGYYFLFWFVLVTNLRLDHQRYINENYFNIIHSCCLNILNNNKYFVSRLKIKYFFFTLEYWKCIFFIYLNE